MDPLAAFCPFVDCPARGHTARGNIKIHCRKRRRYRCTQCGKTFSERRGTPFLYAHTRPETIALVLTLIAHGCPVTAIEAAFGFQRRTVRGWIEKAGFHCRGIHEHLVLRPQVLHHVQADEIFVRSQACGHGRWLYLFSALCVSTRLWLGGLISQERGEEAARQLAEMVRRAALPGPLLVVFWSFAGACAATKRLSAAPFAFRSRPGTPGGPG